MNLEFHFLSSVYSRAIFLPLVFLSTAASAGLAQKKPILRGFSPSFRFSLTSYTTRRGYHGFLLGLFCVIKSAACPVAKVNPTIRGIK